MQVTTCREIAGAAGGELVSGIPDTVIAHISTDSRNILPGSLFIPLEGERFDGHSFIQSALDAGAAAVLVHKPAAFEGKGTVIRVKNTATALQDIAAWYRSRFPIPFIGITGSVGKTSTKDMVACVMGEQYRVLKTEGNFNNEIGLPLTMFRLEAPHQVGVIEMGMSGFGEISRLTAIVMPHVAIITNIGLAHIEKLGSRQNILKAKMEILEGLDKEGLVILNGDDKLLYGLKGLLQFRTVFYGLEDGMDYQAYDIEQAGEAGTWFKISLNNREYRVHIPVPGLHHVHNALAAIAAGVEMSIPMDSIVQGISTFSSGKMRMNIIPFQNGRILNDTYNASPQSMEAAIDVLMEIAAGARTIAVLGDMLEMGDWAPDAHRDVGRYAAAKGVNIVMALGENGRYIAEGAQSAGISPTNVCHFKENRQAADFLISMLHKEDCILVKGSRAMKMEEIVEYLTTAR